MSRKPTPAEIASMMQEDQYGQPNIVAVSPAIGANLTGPVNKAVNMPLAQTQTEMRACAATGCVSNCSGKCDLDSISINEHGGCNEYEARSDCDADDNDSRYQEEATDDITGGVANMMQSVPDPDIGMRRNGPWGSRGGY